MNYYAYPTLRLLASLSLLLSACALPTASPMLGEELTAKLEGEHHASGSPDEHACEKYKASQFNDAAAGDVLKAHRRYYLSQLWPHPQTLEARCHWHVYARAKSVACVGSAKEVQCEDSDLILCRLDLPRRHKQLWTESEPLSSLVPAGWTPRHRFPQITLETDPSFTDIAADPGRESIEAAQRACLVAGYPDGTFLPATPLSKQETKWLGLALIRVHGPVAIGTTLSPDSPLAITGNEAVSRQDFKKAWDEATLRACADKTQCAQRCIRTFEQDDSSPILRREAARIALKTHECIENRAIASATGGS